MDDKTPYEQILTNALNLLARHDAEVAALAKETMTTNPNPKWKQVRCVHCAAGFPFVTPSICVWHFNPNNFNERPRCTAPTPEAYIAELEEKLAEEKEESSGLQNLIDSLDTILDCPGRQSKSIALLVEDTAKQRMAERDQARAALSVERANHIRNLNLASAESAKLRSSLEQVDDVLIVNWIGLKDDDYRQALADLVTSAITEHDDPAISEAARKREDELANLRAALKVATDALENLLDTAKSYRSDALGLHNDSLPTERYIEFNHSPKRCDRDAVICEAEAALSTEAVAAELARQKATR